MIWPFRINKTEMKWNDNVTYIITYCMSVFTNMYTRKMVENITLRIAISAEVLDGLEWSIFTISTPDYAVPSELTTWVGIDSHRRIKVSLLSWLKHVGYTVLWYQLEGGWISTIRPWCSCLLQGEDAQKTKASRSKRWEDSHPPSSWHQRTV